MRDLNEIQIFVAVADHSSFDAAARSLGLSSSTVSRRIARLERRLGVALLQRTTRSVCLTSAGRTYRQHCAGVLTAAAQADDALAAHRDDLRGDLFVNAPLLFGQLVLAPVVAGFAAAHPGLRLHVELTNAHVDPVETGCDIVIRTGALQDSTLRARFLAEAPSVVVASPSVLAAHGEPEGFGSLADKPCLVFGGVHERRWRFPSPTPEAVAVGAAFTSNDLEVIRSAALGGVGFALLPRFAVADAIEDGRLAVVALSSKLPRTKLHAIFPGHPIPNAGARALADLLGRHLSASPEWITA